MELRSKFTLPSDLTTVKLARFRTASNQISIKKWIELKKKKKEEEISEKNFKWIEPEKDLQGEERIFLEPKEFDGDDDDKAATIAPTPWKVAAVWDFDLHPRKKKGKINK